MTDARRDIPIPLQLLGLASAGAVATFLWFADPFDWQGDPEAQSQETRGEAQRLTVVADTVRNESDASVVQAVGTGNARQAVQILSDAAGEVTEILFEAGQRVTRGQTLLRLDNREERLAIDLSRIRVADALQTLKRYESVAPSGAVSASEVDAARTALSAARVELSQAELALERRTVNAPFDGVTGLPAVDPGDRITETTVITSLDDRSSILVDFEIPEIFAPDMAVGQDISAETWALPDRAFGGRISALGSRIDPVSRTLRVRASIPNDDDLLRTGMSFNVRLALQGQRYPSVPSIAVQWNRSGAFVWRVSEETVERIPVRVLKRSESWVLVDAPLEPGDRIVVEGVQRLRPGAKVTVQDAAPSTSQRQSDAS